MNPSTHSSRWSRSARLAAVGAGLLLLAGCVMPYSYVQGGYGGGYYTSDDPAPGGYYYDAAPAGYGYYGGGYGYYGAPVGVTIGVSSGWPGYYGYGGYGYRRDYRGSGGHWQGHGGGHQHGWNGSGGHGGSQPMQSSPAPQTPAAHAPNAYSGRTSTKRP